MALQSKTFRGDPKLEAAAISDPAHIVPGATGNHVGKIQLALNRLDEAKLSPDGIYGPATSAAVLAYKQKRNIVNSSYQSRADNIVGKMTMASLDSEMLKLESLSPKTPRIEPLLPPGIVIHRKPSIGPVRVASSSRSGKNAKVSGPQIPDVIPSGPAKLVVIPVNGIATFQVVDGIGETASCDDDDIGLVFDPTTPGNNEFVLVERKTQILSIRGLRLGKSSISVTKSNSFGIPFGFVRLPILVFSNQFVSPFATPVNPRATGLMIDIFGERETPPGFVNYTTDKDFIPEPDGTARPLTSDPQKPPGLPLPNKPVSDICLRNSPISQLTADEMKRIAGPGCRITLAYNDVPSASLEKYLNRVRDKFPGAEFFRMERWTD